MNLSLRRRQRLPKQRGRTQFTSGEFVPVAALQTDRKGGEWLSRELDDTGGAPQIGRDKLLEALKREHA
jgi:hypothetical protein